MALTAIDLFAGAGGLSLAARNCGIELRAAVEINKHACSTYVRHFVGGRTDAPSLFEGDVNSINWLDLLDKSRLARGECSVLLGGPPCQGFSTHRLKDAGVGDPRNELLNRYFDCVAAIRPKTFVVENVSGLLWKRHESYLRHFYKLAKEASYELHDPVVLNARDYGAPQNRKRVFLLGVRSDVHIDIAWPPAKTHFPPESDEVMNQQMAVWRTAADVFALDLDPGDPNARHMQPSARLVEVFKSTPRNGGSRADSNRVLKCHRKHDGHKDVYGRIDPKRPGPTMTTACINPSKGRFVHPTKNHGISARHAARFQTFPEDFYFFGGLTAAGAQIGNAVPVTLGTTVLHLIASALKVVAMPTIQKGQTRQTREDVRVFVAKR